MRNKKTSDSTVVGKPELSSDSELRKFMSALEPFLQERFSYRTKMCIRGLGPTISVSRHAVTLYLRLKPTHYQADFDRPLVIGAMYFRQINQGHGTALLQFLVENAEFFDLGNIVLESTNDASSTFAKKRGFTKSNDLNGVWSAHISELRQHLPN